MQIERNKRSGACRGRQLGPAGAECHQFLEGELDEYDPSMHRIPVRDIVVAWVIAAMLFAALIALPHLARTNYGDTGETGADGTIVAATADDTDNRTRWVGFQP